MVRVLVAVERQDVTATAGWVIQVDVGQAFPPAADADDFAADLATAVDDALDNGIQSGHIAAAGEDTYTLCCHSFSLVSQGQAARAVDLDSFSGKRPLGVKHSIIEVHGWVCIEGAATERPCYNGL